MFNLPTFSSSPTPDPFSVWYQFTDGPLIREMKRRSREWDREFGNSCSHMRAPRFEPQSHYNTRAQPEVVDGPLPRFQARGGAEEPKVCRLAAGGNRIRTIGPPLEQIVCLASRAVGNRRENP
jgi:hypothetical protein